MSPPAPTLDFLPRGASGDILVVKPSSLGDIVHTLPAVAWLHQAWPEWRIHWVVNTEWMPLLQGSPLLASVVEFPRTQFRGWTGGRRALHWIREFRAAMLRHPIQLALDFQGLLRSAALARLSGARVLIGLDDAREGARFFYRTVIPTRTPQGRVLHSIDRYLGLVRALQPECPETSALNGDWLPLGDPVDGLPTQPFIALHPFARGAGKSLGWPAVEILAAGWRNTPVVVVGRTDDPPPPSLPPHVQNLANTTSLLQLIHVLRRAAGVVSADSGPMHLASALRRPLLGIHTWSDPRSVGPYSHNAWIWKGGHIVRRSQIDPALAAQHRPPSPAELTQIAAHLLQEFPRMS
ncbi:MAG: glycosyltransferase family 9 protein [Verrucomicrobiales bacterium]